MLFPGRLARRADAVAYMPQGEATQSKRPGKSAIGSVALHTFRDHVFSSIFNACRPNHEVVAV